MSYIEITEKEFEYTLSHLGKSGYTWKKLEEKYAKENVYMVSINDIHVKVFSSVVDGISRGVGSDAIRVVSWDVISNKPIISSEMRVNRTINWADHLKSRIQSVISKTLEVPRCKICGGIVVEINGRFGKFMGCLNYKNHDRMKKVTEKNVEFWE